MKFWTSGRWLKPLPLTDIAYVAGLTQVDDERWLVVGRLLHGGGFVSLYSPLAWSLEPLSAPPTRAWVACAARTERDLVLAVGAEGSVLRMERGVIDGRLIPERPSLASVSVDVLDREWAGAAGELERGETLQIRLFKRQAANLRKIRLHAVAGGAVGISQRVLNRQAHVRRGKLRDERAIHQ